MGGEIARLEQAIQHARELKARQKEEFAETTAALHDLEKHMMLDRVQVEDLTRRVVTVAMRYDDTPDSAIAADLFSVERSLLSARRSLDRAGTHLAQP